MTMDYVELRRFLLDTGFVEIERLEERDLAGPVEGVAPLWGCRFHFRRASLPPELDPDTRRAAAPVYLLTPSAASDGLPLYANAEFWPGPPSAGSERYWEDMARFHPPDATFAGDPARWADPSRAPAPTLVCWHAIGALPPQTAGEARARVAEALERLAAGTMTSPLWFAVSTGPLPDALAEEARRDCGDFLGRRLGGVPFQLAEPQRAYCRRWAERLRAAAP